MVAVGDWNVNVLPTMSSDPFFDSPNRLLHHSDRRDSVEAWASASHLLLHVSQEVSSVPGGHWSNLCTSCPITRLPEGDQEAVPV